MSASGMLLPSSLVNASVAKQNVGEGNLQSMGGYVLVMTVASVIEPFLSQQHRDSMSKVKDLYSLVCRICVWFVELLLCSHTWHLLFHT